MAIFQKKRKIIFKKAESEKKKGGIPPKSGRLTSLIYIYYFEITILVGRPKILTTNPLSHSPRGTHTPFSLTGHRSTETCCQGTVSSEDSDSQLFLATTGHQSWSEIYHLQSVQAKKNLSTANTNNSDSTYRLGFSVICMKQTIKYGKKLSCSHGIWHLLTLC